MSLPWRKILVMGAALCCALWIVGRNLPYTTLVIDNFEEMLIYERDEASTANGIWIMWSTPTFDFEEPMRTGYFHYSSLLLGTLFAPFLGATYSTFALAAHWNALLHAVALVLASAWMLGRLSGWSPVALGAPLLLALSPFINQRAAEIRVETAMLFWELLALWAMARFWVRPEKPAFKLSVVMLTLGLAAKPTLVLLVPFFIVLNLVQVWWDGQRLWPELRWRLRKGFKYGLVTFILATPNSFFSLGLFVASMITERRITAEMNAGQSGWTWLSMAVDYRYLGWALPVLAAVLLALLVWQQTSRRAAWRRTELDALVAVSLVWSLTFWAFLLLSTRFFLSRYMDPGAFSLLFFAAAALVRVTLAARAEAAVALLAAALLAVPAVPGWLQGQQHFQADSASRLQALQPARDQRQWLRGTLPEGSSAMISADVLFDADHFARSTRFFRYKPYFLDIQPDALVITERRLRAHRRFLGREIDLDNKQDVERKLSAYFFQAIEDTGLYGTLELVDTWPDPRTRVYRFTKPVDAAYRDWLTAKLHEEAGIPPSR